MPSQLQPIVQKDFSGGLNLSVNPYLIPKKQLWRVNNMLLDEHGSLRTRPGSSVVSTTQNVCIPTYYMDFLTKANGSITKWILANDGSTSYVFITNNTPYLFAANGSFLSGYTQPQSVTVLDKELIAGGYGAFKIFDGTTVSAVVGQGGQTPPPGAKHVAYHLGSLWVWNTNATTTTLDGPSSLRMAASGKVNDWPDANQAFIGKDDGQVGMGLASYTIVETGISPISTLVAFKNYSAYQISGVFGSTTLAIQQMKTDMGCIAPRTLQFVSGFGLIRLTHKGFALYNGVDDKLLSEDVRPAIYGNAQDEGDIKSLDFSRIETSMSAQLQNPPLYVCACPVEGETNLTRFFIFDLIRKAWTLCTFPYPISWIGTKYENGAGQLFAASATDGFIYRLMGLSDIDDNGSPVEWDFRTGPISSGDPTGQLFWRRLLLDIVSPQGSELTYSMILNGYPTVLGTPVTTGIRSLSTLVKAGRTDIDILRTAPSLYAICSGSGPFKLRGMTWQVKKKPLTRAIL